MIAYYDSRLSEILTGIIALGIPYSRNLMIAEHELRHKVQDAVKIIFLLFRYFPEQEINMNQRCHHTQCSEYEEHDSINGSQQSHKSPEYSQRKAIDYSQKAQDRIKESDSRKVFARSEM